MTDFRFTVDKAHTRRHNEYFGDVRRAQFSAAILAVICGGIAAGLWLFTARPTWVLVTVVVLGVMALGSAIMIVLVPARVGSPQKLYASYPLAPAVVVDVRNRGLTILALVNASTDSATTIPALCTRSVKALPGHQLVPGERVPVVAVGGYTTTGKHTTFDQITPVPIAWSTPNKDTLTEAEAAIPPAQWEQLMGYKNRWKDVAEQPANTLVL